MVSRVGGMGPNADGVVETVDCSHCSSSWTKKQHRHFSACAYLSGQALCVSLSSSYFLVMYSDERGQPCAHIATVQK